MTHSEFFNELGRRFHAMTYPDRAPTFTDVLVRFGDDGTKELSWRLLEQVLQNLIHAGVTARIGGEAGFLSRNPAKRPLM